MQSDVATVGLKPIVHLIKSDEDRKVHGCIFVNFKPECSRWTKELESKLIDERLDIDVVQTNGDMDKHEKFVLIRLFTSAVTLKGFIHMFL